MLKNLTQLRVPGYAPAILLFMPEIFKVDDCGVADIDCPNKRTRFFGLLRGMQVPVASEDRMRERLLQEQVEGTNRLLGVFNERKWCFGAVYITAESVRFFIPASGSVDNPYNLAVVTMLSDAALQVIKEKGIQRTSFRLAKQRIGGVHARTITFWRNLRSDYRLGQEVAAPDEVFSSSFESMDYVVPPTPIARQPDRVKAANLPVGQLYLLPA